MPVLDYDDEFTTKDGQAVTAAAIGTKVKDGGAAKDWGAGEPLVPYARITDTADSNPTTSMTIDIIASSTVDLTGTAVVLSTITVLKAALLKNTLHKMPPLAPGTSRRYLGAKFTPNGGDATTGKYVCGLIEKNARPQDGVNYL